MFTCSVSYQKILSVFFFTPISLNISTICQSVGYHVCRCASSVVCRTETKQGPTLKNIPTALPVRASTGCLQGATLKAINRSDRQLVSTPRRSSSVRGLEIGLFLMWRPFINALARSPRVGEPDDCLSCPHWKVWSSMLAVNNVLVYTDVVRLGQKDWVWLIFFGWLYRPISSSSHYCLKLQSVQVFSCVHPLQSAPSRRRFRSSTTSVSCQKMYLLTIYLKYLLWTKAGGQSASGVICCVSNVKWVKWLSVTLFHPKTRNLGFIFFLLASRAIGFVL